jgi:hypothetical protein
MENRKEEDFITKERNHFIMEKTLLSRYLVHLYKDLTSREKEKELSCISFREYTLYSSFVAESLFRVLNKTKGSRLILEDFVDGIENILTADQPKFLKFIFKLCDFDDDESVNVDDIKLVFHYLEESSEKNHLNIRAQFDSIFKKSDYLFLSALKREEFFGLMKNNEKLINGIIRLIHKGLPISSDSVNILKLHREKKKEDLDKTADMSDNSFVSSTPLKGGRSNPNSRNTSFVNLDFREAMEESEKSQNISGEILKTEGDDLRCDDEDVAVELPDPKTTRKLFALLKQPGVERAKTVSYETSNMQGSTLSDLPNEKEIHRTTEGMKKLLTLGERKEIRVSLNFDKFSSTTLPSNSSHLDPVSHLTVPKFKTSSNTRPSPNIEEVKFSSLHEGFVFKLSGKEKIRKFWIAFINRDIYYFNSSKDKFKGLHNISACYAEIGDITSIKGKEYFSFYFIFDNKIRTYYCETEEESINWVETLNNCTGYRDVYDYYEMYKVIGKGHFGEVRLGADKRSKEYVAIKIINKSKLKQIELEATKSEAEILLRCNHRNIVKLLDKFETFDHIYLVFENLSGGDLYNLVSKHGGKLDNESAKYVMFQIGEGMKYLYSLGIIHRDLKPDNIMLNSHNEIKIVDFGMSKIVGKDNKVGGKLGTLAYIAPEVIQGRPYNKEIDIWSLGIILYNLLTGKVPFSDPKHASKILTSSKASGDMFFSERALRGVSSLAIDLMRQCLIEQSLRINILQFLEHPWFHT